MYGNAIYIIKKGKYSWQEITKTSKWNARTNHSNQIVIINHSDSWLERLRNQLETQ